MPRKLKAKSSHVEMGNLSNVEIFQKDQLPTMDKPSTELEPIEGINTGKILLDGYRKAHKLMNESYSKEDYDMFMDTFKVIIVAHREIREAVLNMAGDPDRKSYEDSLLDRVNHITKKKLASLADEWIGE